MNPTSGPDEGPAGTPRPARRAVLRAVFTATVLAGTGGALAPVLLRGQDPGDPGQDRDAVGPERFSELYRGRTIRGTATAVVPAGAQPRNGESVAAPAVDVSIDGRTLHVMRRADGSYLSTVNHYESFPTLLETARAAVDELGTAQLSSVSPHTI
ncbi:MULTISPECIES: tyrosinase family oxidase copper chaperone [Streptomyces]|uniref:Tyrosinase family oxidase copper chaperone n=1 Tax=Streptomyces glycanivorans TaxID=3033808 RepID=A0ABY9JL23_9ACTN|nr:MULTISPECIES: tyrosinase family oxidase copper chaperone [unclassified Streptomyces]WLQ68403.1 tyrosinase family oxidase copper chaperone [Streptomyces sp. Alt3]WSR04906.1 tyrosinase cofactor [Streptomyces sp. NBC_01208]WSR52484.1 tyrosinase cofactor [Streptomyces sp. NBC_01201]